MDGKKEEKVLLVDCDPGVDDCAALMMIMAQIPSVNIVGITCANGNTRLDQLVLNALRIVKLCGFLDQVPVFRGCENPLVATPRPGDGTYYHGRDGLGDAPDVYPAAEKALLRHVKEEHAVNAIIRLSVEYAGRLQILCIGALTNIAIAEKMDPTLPSRVKSIHVLGGTIRGVGNASPCAEYNFLTDPEAAYNVLRLFSLHCLVQVVPYEVTVDCAVPTDWFRNVVAGPGKKANFFRSVFKYSQKCEDEYIDAGLQNGYIFCDAYLAAIVIQPAAIKKSKKCRVTIELGGGVSRGLFVIDHRSKESPHLTLQPIEVIEDVHMDIYKGLLKQAFE